jgi:2-oxoisovalerate dehydrogenase E1 component alpha subunit
MYRITPHSSDDDDRSYRTREEVDENKKKDPILVNSTRLMADGVLTEEKMQEMEERAKEIVDEAVEYSVNAPYPDVSEGAGPVYAEEVSHA